MGRFYQSDRQSFRRPRQFQPGEVSVAISSRSAVLTSSGQQGELGFAAAPVENPDYLSRQIITYIGNKRALLGQIGLAVEQVKQRLGNERLAVWDAFSGSGVVSRYLKGHSERLVSSDLEDYAAVIARCYLRNKSAVDWSALENLVAELNARVDENPAAGGGFIAELYSPRDESNIRPGERVFYTPENARRLDNYRQLIADCPAEFRDLLLGPLLSAASVHSNTAGIFKGFYKDRRTGIGQYGGTGADALSRIKGQIRLELPVLSNFEGEYQVEQGDANSVARQVKNLDLAYIDPPYNQHPYGSNYFMLNLLVNYRRPEVVSPVSGIPTDWRRSGYNIRPQSPELLRELLRNLDAPFLLLSFNNEGFISRETMEAMLREIGAVNTVAIPYNTFRGSRNLRNRPTYVTEWLFLVEKTRRKSFHSGFLTAAPVSLHN